MLSLRLLLLLRMTHNARQQLSKADWLTAACICMRSCRCNCLPLLLLVMRLPLPLLLLLLLLLVWMLLLLRRRRLRLLLAPVICQCHQELIVQVVITTHDMLSCKGC
jgi:hypothetical protein